MRGRHLDGAAERKLEVLIGYLAVFLAGVAVGSFLVAWLARPYLGF